MATAERHRWQFAARFRHNAFGWRSQPAIARVQEAVAEVRKVRRSNSVLAAEGAVSIKANRRSGLIVGGADFRRSGYAVGW